MRLILGDCLEKLKEIEANSVDAVVTDSPYGLKLMNKQWDYDVPSVKIWTEVLRVLKPGGHVLSFGGTRTYHRMTVNIEDAGFDIRDCVQWIHGQGFPKSYNIKEGDFKGYGTALKPACEIVCLARKPLEKGLTVAQNVIKYGTGALNIDESRIEYQNEKDTQEARSARKTKSKGMEFFSENGHDQYDRSDRQSIQGRWPSNVIFDEVASQLLDEQSGLIRARNGYGVKGQSGGGTGNCYKMPSSSVEKSQKVIRENENGTLTGASRYFYCAKASIRERNAGLDDMDKRISSTYDGNVDHEHGNRKIGANPNKPTELRQNHHPTVKPIKLMQYLITLITPPNGIVLDPFMGSGSTGIACKNLNRDFIGIEKDPEYYEIANKRIENHLPTSEKTI